jgi:hypothetical protein
MENGIKKKRLARRTLNDTFAEPAFIVAKSSGFPKAR